MFDIYVRDINPFPNYPGTGEVLLFSIPATSNTERPFLNLTMNSELGNAGNVELTVDPKSKYIDIWRHMRTLIRIKYDGETVFFGRVLTIDRDMFRSKKIHCEGAYTFFMDSVFEGKEKGFNVPLKDYIQMLLDAHNYCMTDSPEKQIFMGEMPGNYSSGIAEDQKIPNETKIFGTNKGYKAVKEWLDELVSNYAGFMRVRYNDSDNKLYLDWMRNYFTKGAIDQVMSVSKNTVDLSDTVEVDNIFTHVLPMGKGWNYSDGSTGGGKGGIHKITVNSSPAGMGLNFVASASKSEAKSGETVLLKSSVRNHIFKPTLYRFAGWRVNSGGVTISGSSYENASFVMGNEDVSITAVYSTHQREGIVMDSHSVSVRCSPSFGGVAGVNKPYAQAGEAVVVSAQPAFGFKFTGFSGGASASRSPCVFTMPNQDVSITANFKRIYNVSNMDDD